MNTVFWKQAAFFMAALCFATAALAQYIWVDEKGVKQFSDVPPPASVPNNRILKQPTPMQAAFRADDSGAQTGASTEADKSAPPMTLAEKNADFLRRRNKQMEKDKKAADEAKRKADTAKNCEHARSYARNLESGQRMARTDKNGERVFLSDAERARELQDAKHSVADCK